MSSVKEWLSSEQHAQGGDGVTIPGSVQKNNWMWDLIQFNGDGGVQSKVGFNDLGGCF